MSFLKGLTDKATQLANEAKAKVELLANEAKDKAEQLANEAKAQIKKTFINELASYGFTEDEIKTIGSTIDKCTLSMSKIKDAFDSLRKMDIKNIDKKTFMNKLNELCSENKTGGYYHKKYLKYKHKYLNLKAQLNL